jgi:hypothetical protein
MPSQPTPENLRSEMARRKLKRSDVCEQIGMHPNALTMYLNETRPLTAWAAHNIGYGINAACGLFVVMVDMSVGVLPMQDVFRSPLHLRLPHTHRKIRRTDPIPAVPKRKRRRGKI